MPGLDPPSRERIRKPLFHDKTIAGLLLLVGLHGSIAAMVNLGIFSAAMIAFDPFLLDTVHWNLLGRLATRKRWTRTVFYDVDCGVCFARTEASGVTRFSTSGSNSSLAERHSAVLSDPLRYSARPRLKVW